jgi:hypothetical protein
MEPEARLRRCRRMYEKVTFSSPREFYTGGLARATGGRRNEEDRRAAIYFGREFTYHVRCQRGRSWARLRFAVSRDQ